MVADAPGRLLLDQPVTIPDRSKPPAPRAWSRRRVHLGLQRCQQEEKLGFPFLRERPVFEDGRFNLLYRMLCHRCEPFRMKISMDDSLASDDFAKSPGVRHAAGHGSQLGGNNGSSCGGTKAP